MTIAMLTAVLVSLGALMLRTTQRSAALDAAEYTHAVVTREMSRFVAMPFASLPAHIGCNRSHGAFPYTKCVSVTDLSPQVRRLMLVITPAQAGVRPDTVILDRAAPPPSPFRGW